MKNQPSLFQKEGLRSLLSIQLKLLAVAVCYFVIDYIVLRLAHGNLVWMFTSWILLAILYLGMMIKFFFNTHMRAEVRSLFSIAKFKEGLREV